MESQTPSQRMKKRISEINLRSYIKDKSCRNLANIYSIDLERGSRVFHEDDFKNPLKGTVVALDTELALYYFINRGWGNTEEKYNEFYNFYEKNGGIERFVRKIGTFG